METLEVALTRNAAEDTAPDLELWMTNLPHQIRSMPLISLSIPGSHDSMSYGISSASKIAPDAEPVLKALRFLGRFLTGIMSRWGRTQDSDVTRQLFSGIRYFDLRIATRKKSDEFYFVHGLYGDEVFGVLGKLRSFLETHPKEVVILDCQHFYAFQPRDHERLMTMLTAFFGDRLVPWTPKMRDVSLHGMTRNRQQAMIIYRSDAARFGQPRLWPAPDLPTPWPETTSVPKLIAFLVERLERRDAKVGLVSQCVLTPTAGFVARKLFSSLRSACFLPLEGAKYRWLNEQRPGPEGVNVVISDFVGYGEGTFAKTVIGLNRKLLGDGNDHAMTPIDDGL